MMHRFTHQRQTMPHRDASRSRRGAASLWIILAGPALLGMLILVIELAHIWLARVELENALGATALAAVKEWGDAGGGSTECPRNVGINYAAGNNIVGVPLALDPNFGGMPNENATCDGNLIFGAILDQNAPYRFDASQTPSCGGGFVALDVTGQSSLGGNNRNSFGISFQPGGLPANSSLRITRVIYVLPENCGGMMPRFDFSNDIPLVSLEVLDCSSGVAVQDNCPSGGMNPGPSAQADVDGITPAALFYIDVDLNDPCNSGDLVVSPIIGTGISRTMAIEFPDIVNNDLMGFDIEERIRFGANVIDAANNSSIGGDEIGACGTQAIICFNDNTTVTGTFIDNDEKSNQCLQCVNVASWGSNTSLDLIDCLVSPLTGGNHGLIIHPNGIPDIPCPPSSGNNNNGQSILTVTRGGGAGQFPFAVRAQATVEVKCLFSELCGIPLGPFHITAKETAFYDCTRQCPRLIRIEPGNFFCPGPAP